LLWRSDIFDGAKTGYHSQAGYCLVGSAIRGDMRLVAVVLEAKMTKGLMMFQHLWIMALDIL